MKKCPIIEEFDVRCGKMGVAGEDHAVDYAFGSMGANAFLLGIIGVT